jgi:uncharacterized DUF497 family protein
MPQTSFQWDDRKDAENRTKHGVSFSLAQEAFFDPHRVIARDLAHCEAEERFYCSGARRQRRSYGSVYVAGACPSHHRCGILEKGEKTV